jgi:hypothetical protein
LTNRSTYEASVKSAGTTQQASIANAQTVLQTSVDAVRSVVGYTQETGNNANLVSTTNSAARTLLEAYANAEKAKQASLAAARELLKGVASPAALALGYQQSGTASSLFSGSSIAAQLSDESEEAKRRRLAALAASRIGGVGAGYGSAISAAGASLIGS